MREKRRRGRILQGRPLGLFALGAFSLAQAQVQPINFQVIHLPRAPNLSEKPYIAIRSAEQWAGMWHLPSKFVNKTSSSPPSIDFGHFILLIASTGVKPSSGYSIVFTSVLDSEPTHPQSITVNVLELDPGSCPVLAKLTGTTSYILIPQTNKRIRFVVSKADSNCNGDAAPIIDEQ
jgi:hypothetical protein